MSDDVKMDPVSSCPEFEDLSPDSRMECKEELDREIAALQKKRDAVVKILESDPMDRTLLVVGVRPQLMPTLDDFKHSFKEMQARRGRYEGTGFPTFTGFEVFHEENYKFQNGAWLKVKECFIVLRSIKETRCLLECKDFFLTVGGNIGSRVTFARPPHDDATRKTFTEIGGRVERLQVVRKELSTFLTEVSEDRPKLSSKYVDNAVFKQHIKDWKVKRASGKPLSRSEYSMLTFYIPVSLKKFQERFDELWDEQTDIILDLRNFQADDFKFEF